MLRFAQWLVGVRGTGDVLRADAELDRKASPRDLVNDAAALVLSAKASELSCLPSDYAAVSAVSGGWPSLRKPFAASVASTD